MSKKIALKSVFAIVMVGFILSVSSCQKEEKKIIGEWEYETATVTEFSCSDPLLSIFARSIIQQSLSGMAGTKIEFTKDGKAITVAGGMRNVGTYKVNGNKLTLITDGYSETYDVSFPKKKEMQWDMDMNAEMLEVLSWTIAFYLEEEVEITKCKATMTLTKK